MASWWFAKDDTENSFTDVTYAEQLTLEFVAPALGDYLIFVGCQANINQTGSSVGVRAQIDDTTTIMEGLKEDIGSSKDAYYHSFSTVYLAENLALGSHYIDLDAYVEAGTGYINYMKIVVVRVDDWLTGTNDYAYTNTEAVTDLTSSWATYETLTFTPGTAGDYLVLGYAELYPGTTSNTAEVRLNYDSASEYLPVFSDDYMGFESEDEADYHCFAWGGIVNIPASSKTILLEGKSTSASASDIRKRRIIAIRIAAMDDEAITDEDASETSSSSEWADRSTITFTPPSTADYLILAGSMNGRNSEQLTQQRLNHTVGTDTGVVFQDFSCLKDYTGPSDFFSMLGMEIKELTATSQTFKTQYGNYLGTFGTTYNKGSWIVAIRKPTPPEATPWLFEKLDTEISFTNVTYSEKLRLDFSTPSSGDYLIMVSTNATTDNFNIPVKVRAQVDDTTTIMEARYEPQSLTNDHERRNFSTVYLAQSLAAGTHHVDIDALVSGATTAYLKYMKITVVRLDDWLPTTGMYDTAATEGSLEIYDIGWTTAATLTFTPDTAGDYLILGTAGLEATVVTKSINLRLNYDSGSEYIPLNNSEETGNNYACIEANHVDDHQSFVIGGIISLPASEKTILLEVECGADPSYAFRRRIIAIRIGAMDSSVVTDEDTSVTSTSSQWTDRSSITFSPPSIEDYLIISGMIIKPDAEVYPGGMRLNQTAGTGTGIIARTNVYAREADNPADCIPQFTTELKSLAAVSQTIKTQWGYVESADDIYSKASFIIAIRKPTLPDADPWVFGKEDTEISLTNTSYEEKFTLDFNAPAQGDYMIVVSTSAISPNTSTSIGVRAQLDNTTTIMEALIEPCTGGNRPQDYRNVSTVYLAESLSSGSHHVDIDAKVASSTGYMEYMKIAVVRLDDWLPTTGMYDSAATEGEVVLTTSWATYETLTFTPDQTGDYLILGSCELKTGDLANTSNVRLNYDAGSEYLPVNNSEETGDNYVGYQGHDVTDYHSFVWGGIVNIPASSKTIILQGVSTVGSTSYVRKRRVIAIRLAAMDSSVEYDEDPANGGTSAQWADKTFHSFTPPSTGNYLLINGIVIKPDSTATPGHARFEQTLGTGTGTIGQTNVDAKDAFNPADCIPHFTIESKSLTNTLQVFRSQYGYAGASGTCYSKGSFIIAIREPSDETTAYKDVTFKTSLLSADTYKDVTFKTSLLSATKYKDIVLKTSLWGLGYKDITFKTSLVSSGTYKITGVTKDIHGNILGSCECYLVKDNLDNTFTFKAYQLSNAGTGVYTFTGLTDNDANYQVIAWKDDTPHVFDVTDWVITPEAE